MLLVSTLGVLLENGNDGDCFSWSAEAGPGLAACRIIPEELCIGRVCVSESSRMERVVVGCIR